MDSFTQITLGAAVGEVVLGKKAGNRAMLWGAIGGTIPDLDVLANIVTDEISALAFHRAITHSFAFAILTPAALGWLVHRIYQREGINRLDKLKSAGIVFAGIIGLISLGILFMPIPYSEVLPIAATVGTGIIFIPLLVLLRYFFRKKPLEITNPSWWEWSWLFFWAIFTHPLLDSCTTYGTQLFQPFSDSRVALNNISVVDPIYTVPFLICVIIASFFSRHTKWRHIINYIGIGLSSIYLLFSFYNKARVDHVFESSLQKQEINYQRYTTSPTIFNNILWQGVAEGDSVFFHGMYSLLDQQKQVTEFSLITKNQFLLEPYAEERGVKILKWFSSGYYSILSLPDGSLQFNDLRFGSLNQSFDKPSDFVFRFIIKEENGQLRIYQSRERPANVREALGRLVERMKGI